MKILHVVSVGAHPDDPESCGGALVRYVEEGHRTACLYLTRGEGGIPGKSNDETAAIRTAECLAACKILGAAPLFAGQVGGATAVDQRRKDEFYNLLMAQEPDVVFGHWPLDMHSEHAAAALLSIHAYFRSKARFQLYLWEAATGLESFNFTPTVYVDITSTVRKKKAALIAHKSQNVEANYRFIQGAIDEFRGRELSVAAAEAYIPMARDHGSGLPGL
jgi:LmbE family N-acetylglucosaminyl deacetylase